MSSFELNQPTLSTLTANSTKGLQYRQFEKEKIKQDSENFLLEVRSLMNQAENLKNFEAETRGIRELIAAYKPKAFANHRKVLRVRFSSPKKRNSSPKRRLTSKRARGI